MSLTPEKLAAVKFWREMLKKPVEEWDGTLEQARRQADEFTGTYGQKAFVIRKKNKYEWVAEGYFKTFGRNIGWFKRILWKFIKPKSKHICGERIYHETTVNLDYEI